MIKKEVEKMNNNRCNDFGEGIVNVLWSYNEGGDN